MTDAQQDGLTLDDLVEQFEQARSTSDADLLPYLPAKDHPQYADTLVELIRVDLEFAWQADRRPKLDEYRQRFASVLSDPIRFAPIAFEEFRLRRAAGEQCSREEYRERYGVASDSWPELPVGQVEENGEPPSSWLRELSQVDPASANRIAGATRQLPKVGERFLDFELVGELGRGAFGRAYLARQGDLANRFVALKVTAQITDEPQRLAQLQHTNIVPIYSLHQKGSLQAVCMPFLGPNTLADVLQTFQANRSIPISGHALVSTMAARQASTVVKESNVGQAASLPDENDETSWKLTPQGSETLRRLDKMSYLNAAAWIVARLAGGLAHAHEHGIVHRDLKPANILLSDDGEPLILDFNLSSQSSAVGSSAALVGGTLPYMAPEHIIALQQGGEVGSAADIYSLGVILFEMLTGELPYELHRGSFEQVTARMLKDREQVAPSVTSRNPKIPGDLGAIVSKCLALPSSDRYVSAHDLQEDLERHLDNLPLIHAAEEPIADRVRKWCRRHPRTTSMTSVATVAAALLICLAVLLLVRGQRIERYEANEQARRFVEHVQLARTSLNLAGIDDGTLSDAVTSAEQAANMYHLLDDQPLEQDRQFQLVSLDKQEQLHRHGGELLYLLGSGKALLGARAESDDHRKQYFQEALRCNELARLSFSQSVPRAIFLQRARLLDGIGRSSGAAQAREAAESDSTASDFDRRLLASELNFRHDYAATIELLEALLRDQPQDYTAWFGLGSAHYRSGHYGQAEACFTTCLALRPQLDLGHFMRGVTRLSQKSHQGAKADFDVVLGLHPSHAAALVNRGLSRMGLGDPTGAITDLSAAIDANVAETRVFFLRAKLRQQTGDAGGAAEDLAEGLRRTPSDEVSWITRGHERMREDPEGALSDFQEALRLNPRSAAALQNTAHVLSERLDRNEEAVVVMEELVQALPDDALVRVNRGVLLARLKRKEDAIRDAEVALQASPPPPAVYRAACIYALLADDDDTLKGEAIKQLGRALRAQSSFVTIAVRDRDLDSIRDDPAVRQLLSAAMILERTSSAMP